MRKQRHKTYTHCPVEATLDIIGGKWKSIILFRVIEETRRFNELRRLIPSLTQRMLTNQLRELEHDGLIARKIYAQVPPKVEYSITAFGKTLEPVLLALKQWAEKNMLPRMAATNAITLEEDAASKQSETAAQIKKRAPRKTRKLVAGRVERDIGGVMEPYRKTLKEPARLLRNNMTDAEQLLWYRIRRKQIQGVQFYRQKPLLAFVVDFYCPAAKLVIELDGSQHLEAEHQAKDQDRDAALASLGLRVLRFDNRQVLLETDAVLAVIDEVVRERALEKSNPNPP